VSDAVRNAAFTTAVEDAGATVADLCAATNATVPPVSNTKTVTVKTTANRLDLVGTHEDDARSGSGRARITSSMLTCPISSARALA
jgi:hypothetical protein